MSDEEQRQQSIGTRRTLDLHANGAIVSPDGRMHVRLVYASPKVAAYVLHALQTAPRQVFEP